MVGKTYVLTFQYANNVDTGWTIANVNVTGANTLLDVNIGHARSTRANMNYQTFYAEFVADSDSATLTFMHLDSMPNTNASGLALDAVSVKARP